MLVLERLIEHFRARDGARSTTMGDYAARWKSRNVRADWADAHGVQTGSNSLRSL